MTQFYVSYHGPVIYLCLRDENHPWYGQAIKRLDKALKSMSMEDLKKQLEAL